jgi:hypothetical protein
MHTIVRVDLRHANFSSQSQKIRYHDIKAKRTLTEQPGCQEHNCLSALTMQFNDSVPNGLTSTLTELHSRGKITIQINIHIEATSIVSDIVKIPRVF